MTGGNCCSLFSLFSEGITARVFQTPISFGGAQTTYTAPHTNNPLDYGWNPFQSSPTNSQLAGRGNPTFTFGNQGEYPSTSQTHAFQAPVRPKISFLATLNLIYLSKLMNDPVKHSAWTHVPTKLPSDIPKFERKTGEDPGAHITSFH